jgi:hypothetical protein
MQVNLPSRYCAEERRHGADTAAYSHDLAGRPTLERHDGEVTAEYFYDRYPGDDLLGLSDNFEWEGYPAYAVTIGRGVAVKDRSGVTISAGDYPYSGNAILNS